MLLHRLLVVEQKTYEELVSFDVIIGDVRPPWQVWKRLGSTVLLELSTPAVSAFAVLAALIMLHSGNSNGSRTECSHNTTGWSHRILVDARDSN